MKCKICKEYHWSHQKCNPIFYCQIPDYHNAEWDTIRAEDHTEAAEKYCEIFDSENGGYDIIGNEGLEEIRVKDEKGIIKKFKIVAYPMSVYEARIL
jgi:hypothetical protein